YRQMAADLATVREDPSGRQTAEYLNRLLGRAHNVIYGGSKVKGRSVLDFYVREYPQVFRETFSYTFAAFSIFFVAAITGLLFSMKDPSFPQHILGANMLDTINRRQMWPHSIVRLKPIGAVAMVTNSLRL